MQAFEEAGIAVYALSYDEPEALVDFRAAHNITYALLSDPDSVVIRRFGILNTLIDENDHPWFGIPYPGTYVIDATGRITHKFFDNNLAVRAGPEQLLRAALGEAVSTEAAVATAGEVSVDVRFDADALTPTVQKDLVATFTVPSSRHVYAEPAPAGSIACDIVLDEDASLVPRALRRPAPEKHRLAGTEEPFLVHHGQFELRLPLTVNNGAMGKETMTVSGKVEWQSCDDEVCDVPTSQRFEITVAVTSAPKPALFGKGAELEPDAMAHFQYMTERRSQT